MVRRIITNLDTSKASGPDCIPVVILKNCEAERSCIVAEIFNMSLKEPCFLDFWKVSSVVPVFKIVGKGLQLKINRILKINSSHHTIGYQNYKRAWNYFPVITIELKQVGNARHQLN